MLIDELLNCTYDELINYIIGLTKYIDTLEDKIDELEREKTDKINKDFEDNKKLVGEIINSLCG